MVDNINSLGQSYAAFQKALGEMSLVEEMRKKNRDELMAALATMKAALEKPRGAMVALQIAQTQVIPQAVQSLGGGIGEESAKLDMGSALRSFGTSLQGAYNSISANGSTDDATKMLGDLGDLWSKVLNNGTWDPKLGIDQQTFNGIASVVKSIYANLGVAQGQQPDAKTALQVAQTVKKWANPDDPTKPPVTQVTNIQNAFQQFTNTVSIPTQQTQIKLQYQGNQYNQYLGVLQQIINTMKALASSLVKGQRAS